MVGNLLRVALAVLLLGVGRMGLDEAPALAEASDRTTACSLRMGWDPYGRLTFQDEDGTVTGADIVLIKAVAEDIGCGVSFREIPWRRLLLEIEKGTVDVTSSASWTEERAHYAWFSIPYRRTEMALFVRKGTAVSYDLGSLADVPRAGFRLGVIDGYFLGGEFANLMADPEFATSVEGAADYAVNLAKLLHGRIDGFLVDDVAVLLAEAEALGMMNAFERHPITIAGGELHFMFSRASVGRDVVNAFDRSLARMKAEGRVDRIFQQFLTEISP